MQEFLSSFNYAIKISKGVNVFAVILNLTVSLRMLKNIFNVKEVYYPAYFVLATIFWEQESLMTAFLDNHLSKEAAPHQNIDF